MSFYQVNLFMYLQSYCLILWMYFFLLVFPFTKKIINRIWALRSWYSKTKTLLIVLTFATLNAAGDICTLYDHIFLLLFQLSSENPYAEFQAVKSYSERTFRLEILVRKTIWRCPVLHINKTVYY